MKTITMGTVLGVALAASLARAQSDPDHLQCYRVTDATLQHLGATVDLDAPSIGVAPGCKLSKAKLYCVPARQQIQAGTLSDGSDPIAELPYHGRPAETDRICYQVRCPSPGGTAPDQVATHRFGSHQLRRPLTDLVRRPPPAGARPPPPRGFQVPSPPIDIDPGQDVTYCYYFRTPNLATLAVKRWASAMGPAGRGVVFFTTAENNQPAERRPAGAVSIAECDFFRGTTRPTWRYAGYGVSDELAVPAHAGHGHPAPLHA